MSNKVTWEGEQRPFFHFDQREDGQWDVKCAEYAGENDEFVMTHVVMPDEVIQTMMEGAGAVLATIIQEMASDLQSRRMDL